MNLGLRLVLAILFLGLVFVAGSYLLGDDGPDKTSPTNGDGDAVAVDLRFRWQSSEQCKSCHEDVWGEVVGSHHQISYLNPEVRALSDDFRNKECQACHLPQQIDVTGFAQRALPRLTRPEQGVDCITCHVSANGDVFGARSVPSAPCQPIADARFTSVRLCESCHNQHFTTDQWRASPSAARNFDCNHCHMPDVERKLANGGARTGRHHGYPGAHDEPMLKQAAEFAVRIEGKDLVAALTNSGAGHNFPTEERHRAVDIVYRFVDGSGLAGEWQLGWRFRQPYRDEPGENTQLLAGATRNCGSPFPMARRRRSCACGIGSSRSRKTMIRPRRCSKSAR